MKEMMIIKQLSSDIILYHVISEPGDVTRYDYYVSKNYDDYSFMPHQSTFRFPQRLDKWAVTDLEEEELIAMAKKEYCNPWTLKECIDTIKRIEGELK